MAEKSLFGKLDDGREVFKYTLSNNSGMKVSIINYGAIVTNIFVNDKDGNSADVVLGYDSLEEYINDSMYLGAIVGRFGNRIANAKFSLEGKEYILAANNGTNHLHGGIIGFHKVYWSAEEVKSDAGEFLKLRYESPDGEEGYPGHLSLSVSYTLTEKNELKINYEGRTDKTTIINPTHHSYFNLIGDAAKSITDNIIMLNADKYTPVNNTLIPTGELQSVEGTPMDLRSDTRLGEHIDDNFEQLLTGGGYDHNWVLNSNSVKQLAASVYEPVTGRYLEVFTDQPGIQFYSGNSLNEGVKGKKGIPLKKRTGLCLEAQHFPDSPNQPQFPSVTLKPGEIYRQETVYRFSVK